MWIGLLFAGITALYFLSSLGSSRSKQIQDFSDSYDLLLKMKPTVWSQAKGMSSEQRASRFFMPEIEDVQIIKKARDYIRASMGGDVVEQRAAFGQKVGTNDYAASFDDAFEFYSWLLSCVFHKLQEGSQFRQSEFDLYAKKFSKRFCSPSAMIKAHNLEMPKSLRF